MTKFTDHLWSDLVREHGPELANVERSKRGQLSLFRRPRILVSSTIGLAGVITTLVVALGASTAPAYAITTNSNGSVLVTINQESSLPQANAKLAAMGINERVEIYTAPGAATTSGPVTCTPAPGVDVSGPSLQVAMGTDGTEVIASGQTVNNSGMGTYHLDHCFVTGDTGVGNSGSAGVGNSGSTGVVGAS